MAWRARLTFPTSLNQIRCESSSLDMFAADEASAHLFREVRGSQVTSTFTEFATRLRLG